MGAMFAIQQSVLTVFTCKEIWCTLVISWKMDTERNADKVKERYRTLKYEVSWRR